MKGHLKFKFLSDTCFSSPTALNATVDTEVVLDELGLPMASGKTLHGLLRDTYLTVKGALDAAGDGPALLGSPLSLREEGALRIGDAFLADEHGQDLRPWIRFLLHEKKNLGSALPLRALRDAFLGTRVLTAEERTTGAPKTDTLRWVRVVPQGTTLIAPLMTKRPLTPAELLLLDRLVRLTRHVGTSRNRGLGLVRISVSWQEADTVIAAVAPPSSPNAVRFLHYQLKLTAPCLISARDLDPNSRVTKPFIPGAALRGAIAAALVERQESVARIADIVASGLVRFLHAYPDADGRRALPTPITWRRLKDARYQDADPEARVQDGLGNLLPTESGRPLVPDTEQW